MSRSDQEREREDNRRSSIRDHALDLIGGAVVVGLLGAALIAYI